MVVSPVSRMSRPQQVVGLVGVLDEFLELVQDVAVQEPGQGPVEVIGAAGQHQTQKHPASRTGGGLAQE